LIRPDIVTRLAKSRVELRLSNTGLTLPPAPTPLASYVPAIRTGQLVVCSGQLPLIGKEVRYTGKVGRDLTEAEGQLAAQLCLLNALAAIKGVIGDLDRIHRVVRVEGYVQSAEGFSRQPAVVNGASDLLVQIFGEAGRHSRIAVGVSELPLNAAVELGLWAELTPE
jgi:enamine deaminase RidA (YjgF/YER057c/UK114 family)